MSKLISFFNSKGGVGKSQLTVMCATAAAVSFGKKVLVIDADSQQSIMHLYSLDKKAYGTPPPYDVTSMDSKDILKTIGTLAAKYDLIFFDLAGRAIAENDVILSGMDFVFIPVVPGNFAFEATAGALKTVANIQDKRKAKKIQPLTVNLMVNQLRRTKSGGSLVRDVGQLSTAFNIPLMAASLPMYAAYSDADTYTSIYAGSDPATVAFKIFFDEFNQIIKL